MKGNYEIKKLYEGAGRGMGWRKNLSTPLRQRLSAPNQF